MTTEGVGWVTQVQLHGQWLSWTQWRERERAEQQMAALMKSGRYSAGRVVRVDWTIVAEAAA